MNQIVFQYQIRKISGGFRQRKQSTKIFSEIAVIDMRRKLQKTESKVRSVPSVERVKIAFNTFTKSRGVNKISPKTVIRTVIVRFILNAGILFKTSSILFLEISFLSDEKFRSAINSPISF